MRVLVRSRIGRVTTSWSSLPTIDVSANDVRSRRSRRRPATCRYAAFTRDDEMRIAAATIAAESDLAVRGTPNINKDPYAMDRFTHLAACLALTMASSIASAADITGVIGTLQVNQDSRTAFVLLEGGPTFVESGCSSNFTGNPTSDLDFMKNVWPLVLLAQAQGAPIRVITKGCHGLYPKIAAVELTR